jgi:hypothetical protein
VEREEQDRGREGGGGSGTNRACGGWRGRPHLSASSFQRRATYKRVWQRNNEKGIMGTSKVNYIVVEIYVRWTKL